MTEYTLEIFKTDRRTKAGERLIAKRDFPEMRRVTIEDIAKKLSDTGLRVVIYETYVTKTNLLSGKEFKERYDTPYYCSPSSETYWST